jgi:hypothetical protein
MIMMQGSAISGFLSTRAFSSEVDTGLREENAKKQKDRA